MESYTTEFLAEQITVCSECLCSSCWQGIFMCDKSRTANIIKMTKRDLIKLNKEHISYMKTDRQLQGE